MEKIIKNHFYVYAWNRPCGTPFYIGKGSGKRAKAKRRNVLFSRIVAKMAAAGQFPILEMVKDGLSEREAFDLEISMIAKYGRINNRTGILANMTDGGEGGSGHLKSKEALEKISIAHKGKVITKRHRELISLTNRKRAPLSGKFKGVSFDKASGNWVMSFSAAGHQKKKETHTTEIAAAFAYDSVAREAFGSDCYLNFPECADNDNYPRVTRWNAKSKSKPRGKVYKGVFFHIRSNKWMARVRIDGVDRSLGYYHSEIDAAIAYDKEAYKAYGYDCYLNFPEMIDCPAPRRMTLSEAKHFEPPRNGAFKGVLFDKSIGRWKSAIRVDGKLKHLATSKNPEDCARAYDKAAVEAWGLGNCYLNFPQDFDKCVEQDGDVA